MAINVSFNGSTIFKPGAYSRTTIDLGGGFPLSPAGIVAIFGESDAGTPGALEVNIADNVYSPEALPEIKRKYGAGPIVDACNFLFAPGADGAIPSGAQAVYIYKTNASTQASKALATSWGTVRAKEFGLGGNRITVKIVGAGTTRTITLSNKKTLITESVIAGNHVVITATNPAVGSTVTIDATSVALFDGTTTITLLKSQYASVADLISDINLQTGWTATLTSGEDPRQQVSVLDWVTALAATAGAAIKRDADEVKQFFAVSGMADLISPPNAGLPDALTETALSGGAKGATLTAEITNALTKFEKFRVNSVVPLFSRDATADISDQLTDPASTYTIAGIHQAVKTHLSLTQTTKKKSERQGYVSYKSTYTAAKDQAQVLADARMQMMIQDIRQIDSDGVFKWFQPWAGACLLAGARGGSPVGTPMTFKFLNASGIRHTGQAMSTPEANIVIDFDPDLQSENAIQAGITFMEAPQTGGFRVVVDNTTYGRDGNFVYNRGNVLYAADIVAYDFRNQLEALYIGVKNTVQASEVKSTCETILNTYLAQGITVSSSDAANGFKQLTVEVVGNTINISVVLKLVEGIDFVLADITLQRASTSA